MTNLNKLKLEYIKVGEKVFAVICKIKNDNVFDESGNVVAKLKDYGLVAYKCLDPDTYEEVVIPISKQDERKLLK